MLYSVFLFLQGFHTFLELRGFWDISRSSGTSKSACWSRSSVQLGPNPELRCRRLTVGSACRFQSIPIYSPAISAVVFAVPMAAVHFCSTSWRIVVLFLLILDWIVRHPRCTDWTFAFAEIPFDSRGVVQRVHLDGKVDVLLGC